jgi:hypothetical protein
MGFAEWIRFFVDDPGNLFRTGTASEQGVPKLVDA